MANKYKAKWKSRGLCIQCGCRPHKSEIDTCEICTEKAKNRNTRYQPGRNHTGKLWRLGLKLQVIRHYSPIMTCNCCGESDIRFLQIEHLNGGGAEHRKSLNKSGAASHQVHKWIIDNNYPPGFEILCSNCNLAKHIYRTCPHKTNKITAASIRDLSTKEIAILIGLIPDAN